MANILLRALAVLPLVFSTNTTASSASTPPTATVTVENPERVYREGDVVSLTGYGFAPNDVIDWVLLTKFDGPVAPAEDHVIRVPDFSLTVDANGILRGWVRLAGVDKTDHEAVLLPVATATNVPSTHRFAVRSSTLPPSSRPASASQISFTFSDQSGNSIVATNEQLNLSGTYSGSGGLDRAFVREYSDQDATVQVKSTSVNTTNVTWAASIGGYVNAVDPFQGTTIRVRVALSDDDDFTPKNSTNSLPIPDAVQPTVSSAEAISLTQIKVTFSEPVSTPGVNANAIDNWTITNPSVSVSSLTPLGATSTTVCTLTVADMTNRGSTPTVQFTTDSNEFEDSQGNDCASTTGGHVTASDKIAPATATVTAPTVNTLIGTTSYVITATVDVANDNSMDGVIFEGSDNGTNWYPVDTTYGSSIDGNTSDNTFTITWHPDLALRRWSLLRARAFDNRGTSADSIDSGDNVTISATVGQLSSSNDLKLAFRIHLTSNAEAVTVSNGGDAAKSAAIIIQTENRYGIAAAAYNQGTTTWNLSSTNSTTGKFWSDNGAASQITNTSVSGATPKEFYYTDTKSGTPTVTATESADYFTGTGDAAQSATQAQTINAGSASLAIVVLPGQTHTQGATSYATAITGTPTTQTAGVSHGDTVRAVDSFYNTVTSYAGSVDLTTSDANDTEPDVTTFSSGQRIFTVTNVTAGTGHSVTPVTDLADSVSATYTVNPGTATKLLAILPGESFDPGSLTGISGSPTPDQTAGTPFSITVRATDANWNLVTSATNTVHITGSSTNTQSYPANAALVSGEKTFAVTEKQNIDTHTFTAETVPTDQLTSSTTSQVPMQAASLVKLQVLMPGESEAPGTTTGKTDSPTAQTVGANLTGSITINAVDDYWNRVNVGSDVNINVTTTDGTATITDKNGGTTGNITITNGGSQSTFAASEFKFGTTGTYSVTATDQAATLTSYTTPNVTVNPTTATQLIAILPGESFTNGVAPGKSGSASTQTAGQAFNVTVRAVDASYYLASTATNTVTITGSSSSTQSYPSSAALVSGEKTFSVTERQNISTHTFTASADPLTPSTTASVPMQAGALSKIIVIMPGVTHAPGTTTGKSGAPGAQTVNQNLTDSVRIYTTDDNWNRKATVSALTCTLSTTSGSSSIEDLNAGADGNFTIGDGKDSTAFGPDEFTFGTTGSHTVTATSAIADYTTSSVTVNAGAATNILVKLPGQSFVNGTGITGTADAQTAGSSFNIVLYIVDANNNRVLTEDGSRTVNFSTTAANAPNGGVPTVNVGSGEVDLPATGQTVSFTDGVSTTTISIKLKKAESGVTLSVNDPDPALSAVASSAITVNFGALDNFAVTLASPQEHNVNFTGTNTVTARDAQHNTITNYDASVTNKSVTLTINTGTVLITDGRNDAILDLNTDFSSGVANLTALGFKVASGGAGSRTITATRTGFSETGNAAITVTLNPPSVATPSPSNDTQVSSGASSQAVSADIDTVNSGGSYTLYWLGSNNPNDGGASTGSKSASVSGTSPSLTLSATLASGDLSPLAGFDYLIWWFDGTDGAGNSLTGTPTTGSRARLILDPTVTFTGAQLINEIGPGSVQVPILRIVAQGEMTGMNVNVTRIQLSKSGTATNADIDTLKLYRDADSSQTVTGGDAVLQTITVNTDPILNSPNFNSISQAVTNLLKVHFLVTISINASANSNNTIGYRINASGDVTLSSPGDVGGSFPVPSSVQDQSLPVVLTSFVAAVEGNAVLLRWVTESEINNAGFTIYRAESEPTGFMPHSPLIQGRGSSPFRHEYSWRDIEVTPGKRYFYKIETRDLDGTLHMKDEVLTVEVPNRFTWRLHPNVPNPFNPRTALSFEVPEPSQVGLRIYDLTGRTVRTLVSGSVDPGIHRVAWDGTDERGVPVGSGVYIVRFIVVAGNVDQIQRITLLR